MACCNEHVLSSDSGLPTPGSVYEHTHWQIQHVAQATTLANLYHPDSPKVLYAATYLYTARQAC